MEIGQEYKIKITSKNGDTKEEIIKEEVKENYLYSYGDQCKSLTGGWNIYLQNNGSDSKIQFLEDKIYMTSTSAAYWGHYVNTINRIDLRKYQNLCIKYSSSTKYYSANWDGNYILISIVDQEENSTVIAKINCSADETVEKIDISGINDSYKIRIWGGSIYFLNVYEVWLE